MVTREDVRITLTCQPAPALRAILDAAGVSFQPTMEDDPGELARKVADALWWSFHTPLGYAADRGTLESIVDHVARKAGVAERVTGSDGWARLAALTDTLVGRTQGGVALADLDPKTRARLFPSVWPALLLGTSSSTAYAAGVVGRAVASVGATPIGRLLPYLPTVGPWLGAITRGAGVAGALGTPAAVVLGALTVNQALGTNYQTAVPILLGIGVLRPQPVEEAEEAP